MSVAFLKESSFGRVQSGHPWIYPSDVLKVEKAPEDGGEIVIRSAGGSYVATGFFNSRSRIPIRVFSRQKEKLDGALIRKRLIDARAFRESHHNPLPGTCRLFWSEADFLPGLIVDRYEDVIVVQTLTLALDQRKDFLVEALQEIYHPRCILERNDVTSRQFEGMVPRKGILAGSPEGKLVATLGVMKGEIDLLEGQKTGSYLDQITNQMEVAKLSKGRRVLDCFTYHGGFAIHAALAGASQVTAVDISEDAIVACQRNAELNGVPSIRWKAANVFDDLHSRQRAGEKYDLIVLDPPSFTKTRAKLEEALRGYKEIHLRALKLLAPGGLLATFCCSHHVDAETFRGVVLDAAFDTYKLLRLRQVYPQAWDHPVIPAIPETEYLKGFLFEVV